MCESCTAGSISCTTCNVVESPLSPSFTVTRDVDGAGLDEVACPDCIAGPKRHVLLLDAGQRILSEDHQFDFIAIGALVVKAGNGETCYEAGKGDVLTDRRERLTNG